MFQDLRSPTDFMKPFPAYEEVFTEPLPLYKKHLLPLLSVDVSVVHPDLKFWLHFVSPIEPLLEGNVGDWTGPYHDTYNQDGQIAFRYSQGRYAFTGDFNFFAYESGAIFKGFPNRDEEIHEDYRDRLAAYEFGRQTFLERGRLLWCASPTMKQVEDSRGPFISQLGGDVPFSNWSTPPVNQAGEPFRFIGEIQGFSYCERTADVILLFFDPGEEVALLRYDWT